jgi:hypothetical protein
LQQRELPKEQFLDVYDWRISKYLKFSW